MSYMRYSEFEDAVYCWGDGDYIWIEDGHGGLVKMTPRIFRILSTRRVMERESLAYILREWLKERFPRWLMRLYLWKLYDRWYPDE